MRGLSQSQPAHVFYQEIVHVCILYDLLCVYYSILSLTFILPFLHILLGTIVVYQ